jgi:murein DD-endopeptidase MepM/ murein hydrolase activator NlpD
MGRLVPIVLMPAPRRGRWGATALACVALLATGCASAPPRGGTLHVVQRGENLYRISRHYDISVASIRRANGIEDVTNLQIGQRLRIPGAGRAQPNTTLGAGRSAPRPKAARGDRALALREADLRFAWPLHGNVSSGFGRRGGRPHEGIDIPARKGTPIHAAEAGRVVHSGRLGDYGRVVIVKHAGRYSSVYAHNTKNKVSKGDFVEKGDLVATVGRTGNASSAHLHFELRRDRIAHDPLKYLPAGNLARR